MAKWQRSKVEEWKSHIRTTFQLFDFSTFPLFHFFPLLQTLQQTLRRRHPILPPSKMPATRLVAGNRDDQHLALIQLIQESCSAAMDSYEPNTHSFVVKVWREEEASRQNSARWRGHVTHVFSGERRYFQSLADLTRFIEGYLSTLGVQPASLTSAAVGQ